MKITDLSQPLGPDTLTYPGDDPLSMTVTQTCPQTTYLQTGSHIGTHIDAPRHAFPGGREIDSFPLSTFYGEALCVAPEIRDGLIQAPDCEAEGCGILVVATFWQRMTRDGRSFLLDFPGFSDGLCRYILDRGFRLVATDVPSVDSLPGFRCHNALLEKDIPLVEGLVIPRELAGARFVFAAFPLSIPCDSSPVRAVAIEL